jgi:hypothetical protein
VLFLPRSKHKQTKRPLKRERKTLITSAFGLVNVRSVILSKKKKFLVLSCLDAAQCEKGGCLNVSRKKICKISSKKFEHACLSSEEPQVRKKKKKCCLSSEKPSVKKNLQDVCQSHKTIDDAQSRNVFNRDHNLLFPHTHFLLYWLLT